ncbi:MAG: efflux RND transporter permease subunit [Planctomycetota bacterium]|nr:MAG: efflux RND transporter permease subunit [Planctomycetota bacterium]
MKRAIAWAIEHTPAMNMMLAAVLIVGGLSAWMLRREEFPRFELEIILVQVPYPGASPEEVENGICEKIEEAVRSIDGIKKVMSIAQEGQGNVVIELRTDVPSVQRVLNEVESEIDRITTFPELAEEPEIQQLTIRNSAIMVGVVGPDDDRPGAELRLRRIVEEVRSELLQIPEITVADIQGERPFQIDVEISEDTLRKYGLTLKQVAQRIRQHNLELPGGTIKDPSQEYLLRGKNKRVWGEQIAELPLVTKPDGTVLKVGDLATVRDQFADKTSISRINGRPGMAISVEAAAREDLLAMTAAVRRYVATKKLPPGYEFAIWGDRSIDVKDRLDLLKRNGLQGLVLVFLALALFLDLRLSFWVALGIPVSVLGACAVLWQMDQTLNMLSMFAFLIALGIVVDDAIVVGENIYAHREMGKSVLQAAIDGTVEVLPSVTTSVLTTIFAFVPMFFVTGVMGKFFAVLPLAVIAMLTVSLLESALVLPCHLAEAHGSGAISWCEWVRQRAAERSRLFLVFLIPAFLLDVLLSPLRLVAGTLKWLREHFAGLLDTFIARVYTPLLRWCLDNAWLTLASAVALLVVSLGLVRNGMVPWVIFPKLDARLIEANVTFPDGTPAHVTDEATRQLEAAILRVNERFAARGEPVVRLTYRLVGQVRSQSPGEAAERTEGSHAGTVKVALVDNTQRSVTSQQIVDAWRAETPPIPGVESLTFGSVAMGPGGKPIEFKLLADAEYMDELERAVEECKRKLATYPGVIDIADDSRPGKWEIQVQLREDAEALGIPLEAVAAKVRGAYYGEEVMRLQRGRHEVKLMVRYPEQERRSLARFDDIYVDPGDGIKRPITELAKLRIVRGYSEINRLDQRRSITITADVDEARANAAQVTADLQRTFIDDLLRRYPHVSVRWEGQHEQTIESIQSLFLGLVVALLAMFVLLTLEFNSYGQPAIVMSVIPFGLVGALWGHVFMGLPLTLFSVLGLVALTGVVVNDSIVMVDFINARFRSGMPLREALVESGPRRFRPVLLTSLTTVAGMLPLLTERSFQAQVLIPMATSLCFGLVFSTVLVLILVPVLYRLYAQYVMGVVWEGPADGTGGSPSRAVEDGVSGERPEVPRRERLGAGRAAAVIPAAPTKAG